MIDPENPCITQDVLVFSINFPFELFGSFTRVRLVRQGLGVMHVDILDIDSTVPGTQEVIRSDTNLGLSREARESPPKPTWHPIYDRFYLRIMGIPESLSQMRSTHGSIQWQKIQNFHSHRQSGSS